MDTFSNRMIKKGSPFELQDGIIEGIPCRVFPHAPESVQDVFLKAKSFERMEFIVSKNIRLNFGQALNKAYRFARILQDGYGVGKNSRVSILMDNIPEWAIAFMSIYLAGAVAVVIHADSEIRSVIEALEITGSKLIITDQHNAKKLKAYDGYHLIIAPDIINSGKLLSGAGENKPRPSSPIFEPIKSIEHKRLSPFNISLKPAPDDDALISFTSGSTGSPKGVVLSHRNLTTGLMNMMLGGLLLNCRDRRDRIGTRPDKYKIRPSTLLLSPFSHISGYYQLMLMCYLGGKIVLMPEWNKRQAVTLIENEKIESISGLSPLTISELLHISDSGHKVRTLRNLNIHGSALSHNFLRRIKEHFPFFNIRTGYGMTETSGSISIASGSELLNNPGTGGQVLPSLEIKVIDHNGQIQPHGKQGEICARGAMVMKRYCADPYKTSTVIDNGWLKTGDAGYLDSGGNLYITGRIEDLIIRGKHFISAGKLEQLAGEHHMIDEAVVFSLPDSEKRQNIVLAALPYKSQKVDKGKLKHELFSRIKDLADDCKIILFDSLPRTASGKVNRDVLRRQISSKL